MLRIVVTLKDGLLNTGNPVMLLGGDTVLYTKL